MFIKYNAMKRFSFLHVIVLIVVCVCTHNKVIFIYSISTI